jgi:hypothetical protein
MANIHGLLEEYHKLDATYKLYAPSPTERGELAVITALNAQLKKLKQPIDVKVGTKTFKNIYGANKIAGTPKADIALVTYNKRSGKFENVCFISHKMGTSAKDFQQYSGITTKADGSKAGSISNNPVVLKFLDDLTDVHEYITRKKQRYHRIIKADELIGKSIFGPEYGSNTYNEDNIHVIGQGDANFVKNGASYKLTFSAGSEYNGDVSHFKTGGYTAIIAGRYTSGRNFDAKGKRWPDVRVLIMPLVLIGGSSKEI